MILNCISKILQCTIVMRKQIGNILRQLIAL